MLKLSAFKPLGRARGTNLPSRSKLGAIGQLEVESRGERRSATMPILDLPLPFHTTFR